jgi:hypothetical protein
MPHVRVARFAPLAGLLIVAVVRLIRQADRAQTCFWEQAAGQYPPRHAGCVQTNGATWYFIAAAVLSAMLGGLIVTFARRFAKPS